MLDLGFYFILIFITIRYGCNIFNTNQLTMRKKLLCTAVGISCFMIGTVSAQFSRPISVGAGAGIAYNLTDLANVEAKFAFYGEADYLVSPFISVGLHGEKGTLAGNGYNSDFENRYFAGNINGKVRLGQFMGQKK